MVGGKVKQPHHRNPIGKRKQEKEEEEEKGEEGDEKEEKTKDGKRVRRGGERRKRGRGAARWRVGRHVENVSVTITTFIYTTQSFLQSGSLMQISSRKITIILLLWRSGAWKRPEPGPRPVPGLRPGPNQARNQGRDHGRDQGRDQPEK